MSDLVAIKIGDSVMVTVAGTKRSAVVISVSAVGLQRVMVETEDGVRRDLACRLVELAGP